MYHVDALQSCISKNEKSGPFLAYASIDQMSQEIFSHTGTGAIRPYLDKQT
jgi:hypothetical protein